MQGKCEKRCQDGANRPSNSLWEQIFCSGWGCYRERHSLQVSILQGKCEKRCQDGSNRPSNSLWEQISVQDGVVTEKGIVYRCPFCKGNVRSDVRTGRIDHRTVCGNQFYVKDSAVSKNTRCHAHSCPVCSTVAWSSQSCGRIAVTHVTPSGKRCQMKHWHVPDKKAKKKRK